MQVNETGVDSDCRFTLDDGLMNIDKGLMYNIFKNLTGQGSSLGEYTLDKDSLHVSGYPSEVTAVTARKGLAFWVIIIPGFILLFLLCCLVAFFLRRKAGKYQVQKNTLGIYYPHLDMHKVH